MANTQYALRLKGYVGGADFDRNYVDYVLGRSGGKPVNVLIDSHDGSVATALSIASAFRNHADVSVHFVGMNASAATIASLGARYISIDANAKKGKFTPRNLIPLRSHSLLRVQRLL